MAVESDDIVATPSLVRSRPEGQKIVGQNLDRRVGTVPREPKRKLR